MSAIFTLEAESRAVDVRMDVNDVPLWLNTGEDYASQSRQINPWILPGRNTVRLAIDWPAGVSFQPGRARIELRIGSHCGDRSGGGAQTLAQRVWPTARDETYPAATSLEFEVPKPPPSRLWSQASPIVLTPPVQAEIAALAGRFHAALAGRDVERAAELLDFRCVDVAQTCYTPSGEARRAQRESLEAFLAEADSPEPLYPDTLELHPVARGRVIWVTRPDRAPAIEWAADGCASRIHLYVAPIGGAWTIVR